MKQLSDSVTVLQSVGAKRQEGLHQLGIDTIEDLLLHFPFRFEDIQVRMIDTIMDQEKVTLKGIVVTEPIVQFFGGRKNRLTFKLAVGHEVVSIVFFNQHYLKERIKIGMELAVYGKWEEKRQVLLGMRLLGGSLEDKFSAVYPTNQFVKQAVLVKLIEQAFLLYKDKLVDPLPAYLLEQYHFLSYKETIEAIHFPKSLEDFQEAKRRFSYQEIFLYQLKLQRLRKQRHQTYVKQTVYDNQRLKQYIQTIPFSLTKAQKRVANELCRDLLAPFEMNRLLQGDVGSGKTVVASIAVVASVLAGYQTAIMVPTEILAQQHFDTLQNLFSSMALSVGLLTSSTKESARRSLIQSLKNNELDCLIGTHALIQNDVIFSNLGLVIIDEQHRFGVSQRQSLKEKAKIKNVLYMSATPIPRTLALTMFGEMDVSIIDELPSGRQPVVTRWVKESEMLSVLSFVKKEVEKGRQAYVITPLIEDSQAIDLKNAQTTFEELSSFFGESITVGLLHGKMSTLEKESVMAAFNDKEIDILVSTTVIEVGVNVPNATIMLIQDAERFGLSQLHQLRGRVGRGSYQSYCLLIASPKTDNGKERMRIMTESNDGFYLSQKDLEMRGSGDMFGMKQSGLPDFKFVNPVLDTDLMMKAYQDAVYLVGDEHFETDEQYEDLRRLLK